MRVTIFDDYGNELAEGSVRELKLDAQTRRVDIAATIGPSWHALPEGGGRSAKTVTEKLMEHLVDSGKIEVSYSRPIQVTSIQAVGLDG